VQLLHALVIDDDAAVCEVIAEALGEAFEVSRAHTADTARPLLLAQLAPDLVIADARMAGTLPLTLAEEASQRCPVLIVTGDHLVADALEQSGLDVLRKPFRLTDLLVRANETVFASRRARAELREGTIRLRESTLRFEKARARLAENVRLFRALQMKADT
jgi:DNA-binding NtrC family response regulator